MVKMAVATSESMATEESAVKTGKRKRISFAEAVDQSGKPSKKTKRDKTQEETVVTKNETENAKDAEDAKPTDSIWDTVIEKAKNSGVNYEEAVKEYLVEKLTAMVQDPKNGEIHTEYVQFMKELNYTFQRLHRYPKMISKVLVCIREDIVPLFVSSDKKFKDHKPWSEILLPEEFLQSMTHSVSVLPNGHMIDLWKTIHHNLVEQCVVKIVEDKDSLGTRSFLGIVVTLLTSFMESLKVSDMAIVSTQIDKIAEMMYQMRVTCLAKLGRVALDRAVNQALLHSFLRLSYCWVELQTMFATYNTMYSDKIKSEHGVLLCNFNMGEANVSELVQQPPEGTNLELTHPFLTASAWATLASKLQDCGDQLATDLWTKLLVQKLKVLEKSILTFAIPAPDNDTEIDQSLLEVLRTHAQETIRLVAFRETHESMLRLNEPDIYQLIRIASVVLEPSEILAIGKNFTDSVLLQAFGPTPTMNQACFSFSENFCVRVVAEIPKFGASVLMNVVKTLAQTKVLTKKVLKDSRLSEAITEVLKCDVKQPTALENSLLAYVNELLDSHEKLEESQVLSLMPSSEPLLNFLNRLPLSDFPQSLRNIIFLCMTGMLVQFLNSITWNNEILLVAEKLTTVIEQTAGSAEGNVILFTTKWSTLFQLLSQVPQVTNTKFLKKLLAVSMNRLYVSPQLAKELDAPLSNLCSTLSEISASGFLFLLNTADVLVDELDDLLSVRKFKLLKPKLKHATAISSHILKLRDAFTRYLADISNQDKLRNKLNNMKTAPEDTDVMETCEMLAPLFRSCIFAIKDFRLSCQAEAIGAKMVLEQPDSEVLMKALSVHMDIGMMFLRTFKTKHLKKLLKASSIVKDAKDYCLEFMNAMLTLKSEGKLSFSLPDEYLSRLWRICTKGKLLADWGPEINHVEDLPTTIYEISSVEEFEEIFNVTMEEVESLGTVTDSDVQDGSSEQKLRNVTLLMSKLVDAKLSPEKKAKRAQLWETYLYSVLGTALHWKTYNTKTYLAVLDFQLKLLRRVNPVCSTEALATCFASISCAPLKEVQDPKEFKIVFCKMVDIINAFAMHRHDVISFKTHILLQSFKHAVEYLAFRSDQRNNLPDSDIFEYRSCAYSIERLCQSMKSGEKHFARIVPYFLAIMMRQLDAHVVYPTIKVRFQNGCYKLLDIADDHAIAQMNTMLPTGAREIFKSTYEFYKKFYKFKGKV